MEIKNRICKHESAPFETHVLELVLRIRLCRELTVPISLIYTAGNYVVRGERVSPNWGMKYSDSGSG